MIGKLLKILVSLNLYTLYINFKYLPFKQAIKLPILIFGRVSIYALKGKIIINGNPSFGLIRFGEGKVGIFDKKLKTVLDINGTVIFNGTTRIGHGCSLSVGAGSLLEFGDMFKITAKSAIVSTDGCNITFGKRCLLSWDVLVMNTDFHPIYNQADNVLINKAEDVWIGDDVWFGCRTTVLKGVTITSNAILAANTCVTKSLDAEYSIYAGLPAKNVKKGVTWKWS